MFSSRFSLLLSRRRNGDMHSCRFRVSSLSQAYVPLFAVAFELIAHCSAHHLLLHVFVYLFLSLSSIRANKQARLRQRLFAIQVATPSLLPFLELGLNRAYSPNMASIEVGIVIRTQRFSVMFLKSVASSAQRNLHLRVLTPHIPSLI